MQQCIHEDPIPFPQSSPPPAHSQPANDSNPSNPTHTAHHNDPHTASQPTSSSTTTTATTTDDTQSTTTNDALHPPPNEQTVHDSRSALCPPSTANLSAAHRDTLTSSHTDTGHDTLPCSTDAVCDSDLVHTAPTPHQPEPVATAQADDTAILDEITESTLIVDNTKHDEYKKYRVKVYTLTEDGNWADEGTGHCQFELISHRPLHAESEQHAIDIRVLSESDTENAQQALPNGALLLHHIATKDILYDKQGESIIQWIDASPSSESSSAARKHQAERAISFQHPEQCVAVWRLIAFMKGHQTLSEFETHIKRLRGNKSSSEHQLTQLDNDEMYAKNGKADRKRIRFDSSSDDDEDDDDIRMNKKRKSDRDESHELLSQFFSDHNNEEEDSDDDDENVKEKQRNEEEEEEEEDIDINVDKEICIKTESKGLLKKRKLRFKNRKKSKKKKKKQKSSKKKKSPKSSYFDGDRTHKDDDEETAKLKNEPDSDDSNYSDHAEALSSTDDDEDDDGAAFLNKLTMKTQKKNKKRKLQIPMPTQHNLCEVYSRVKNSIENKDISGINQLANPDWINQLFEVFTALEQLEISRRQQSIPNHDEAPNAVDSTMDVDRTEIATLPTVTSISTLNEKPEEQQKPTDSELEHPPLPSSDIDGAEGSKEHTDFLSISPIKSSALKPPVLTPRLSTASLSTLPPSVEEEENERFHALEFIFLIVLECCRDTTSIKRRKPGHNEKKKSSLKSKFDHIGDGGGYFSMPSFMSFFNSFNGGRSNTTPLCMVYFGKPFLSKTITMLEYDPVRRIQTDRTYSVPSSSSSSSLLPSSTMNKTPELSCSSLLSVRSTTPSPAKPIAVSLKHRDYLKKAKATKLLDIPFADGYDLYEEIEHLYKLTYIRDVVCVGLLGLESLAGCE